MAPALILSAGLAACVFDGESPRIDWRLRKSCPANPFETAAKEVLDTAEQAEPPYGLRITGPIDSNGLDLEISVYDDRENRILHEEQHLPAQVVEALPADSNGNRWLRVFWIMRDEEGDHYPSGYYFIFITARDESKAVPYSGCFFYVNPGDAGKVK